LKGVYNSIEGCLQEIETAAGFLAASNGLENRYPGTKLSENKKTAAGNGARPLRRVTMLKLPVTAALLFAFTFGMTEIATAQTMAPLNPPAIRYVLPSAATGYSADRLREGRSIYRMEAPSAFYYGTDERGYPSGEPQNPRTGD
jgi:hypothetical protein